MKIHRYCFSSSSGARVINLLRHQDQPNALISSFQGNNEVAIWNIDKPQTRQKVFWPSSVKPLSLTQVRQNEKKNLNSFDLICFSLSR